MSGHYCQTCRMLCDADHFRIQHPEPPYDDGTTYTLTQAKRQLALQECSYFGHSWDVVQTLVRPTAIVCSRCGESYAVVQKDRAP